MKKTLIAIAAVLAAGAAHADLAPAVVGFHMVSHHTNSGREHTIRGQEWNNVNPGIYARWANGFTAGLYENSLRETTTYAGWTWQTPGEMFALTAGVATGYGTPKLETREWACPTAVRPDWKCRQGVWFYDKKPVPLVAPSVRFALNDKAAVRLTVLGPRHPVFHLSMEFKLQ